MDKQQLLDEIEKRQKYFINEANSLLGVREVEQIQINNYYFAVAVLESLKDWIKNDN